MQEAGGDAGGGSRAGGTESQGRQGVDSCRGRPRSAGAASAADHRAPGVLRRPNILWGRAETRGPRPKGREANHAYSP